MSESDLIKKCKIGDPKAQAALYAAYADRMFRISLRYVKSQADAEDIVITSFSRVFDHIQTFQPQANGSLEGWIRKIIVNQCLMWMRRRHNFNMMGSVEFSEPEPDLSQLSLLEAGDILKMIEELPTGYRVVFNLAVVEGYSHEEIASLLDISEGTSRSQLFKGKSLLKKMLTREGYQYGT